MSHPALPHDCEVRRVNGRDCDQPTRYVLEAQGFSLAVCTVHRPRAREWVAWQGRDLVWRWLDRRTGTVRSLVLPGRPVFDRASQT